MSTHVLVAYYSTYGHVFELARACVAGAERVPDTEVRLRRIPELVEARERLSRRDRYVSAQLAQADIPEVTHDDLRWADGILWGVSSRYGTMSSQVKNFIDTTGAMWHHGELEGKATGVFTSTGTIHSGQETTILTTLVPLLHLGMIYVGVSNKENPDMLTTDGIGGSPYGATTLSGMDGSRPVHERELAIARSQGARLARVAARLRGLNGGGSGWR